jgi:hypothetical protein
MFAYSSLSSISSRDRVNGVIMPDILRIATCLHLYPNPWWGVRRDRNVAGYWYWEESTETIVIEMEDFEIRLCLTPPQDKRIMTVYKKGIEVWRGQGKFHVKYPSIHLYSPVEQQDDFAGITILTVPYELWSVFLTSRYNP